MEISQECATMQNFRSGDENVTQICYYLRLMRTLKDRGDGIPTQMCNHVGIKHSNTELIEYFTNMLSHKTYRDLYRVYGNITQNCLV